MKSFHRPSRRVAAGLAAGLLLAFGSGLAAAQAPATIEVTQAYARATAPGQAAGGGYAHIRNGGTAADRLVAVQADVARSVELHTMSMDGDVMRMRQVDGIEVPAGQAVELKPGGLHMMFMGLKAPLKAGDAFPATLTFEKAGEVKVTLKVEAAGARPHMMNHGGKH